MEEALGADFGGVRLYTDAQADQLARSLQARAFTTGQDIFFRRGQDISSPASREGSMTGRLFPTKDEWSSCRTR